MKPSVSGSLPRWLRRTLLCLCKNLLTFSVFVWDLLTTYNNPEESKESSLVNMHKAVGSAGGPIVICVFPVNARSSSRGVYLHCGAASCCPPTTLTFPNHTIRFLTPVSWKNFTDSSLNKLKKMPACCSGKA